MRLILASLRRFGAQLVAGLRRPVRRMEEDKSLHSPRCAAPPQLVDEAVTQNMTEQLLFCFIAAILPGSQLMKCNFEALFTRASAECSSPLANGKCRHMATEWQQAGEWQQGPSQQHMAVKKTQQLSAVHFSVHVQPLWPSFSVRHWLQKQTRP